LLDQWPRGQLTWWMGRNRIECDVSEFVPPGRNTMAGTAPVPTDAK